MVGKVYTYTDIERLLTLDAARSQGTVTCHVSEFETDTDLEYRGTDGKWTLATVWDATPDHEANPEYLAFLWNHGAAIIRQLFDAVQNAY